MILGASNMLQWLLRLIKNDDGCGRYAPLGGGGVLVKNARERLRNQSATPQQILKEARDKGVSLNTGRALERMIEEERANSQPRTQASGQNAIVPFRRRTRRQPSEREEYNRNFAERQAARNARNEAARQPGATRAERRGRRGYGETYRGRNTTRRSNEAARQASEFRRAQGRAFGRAMDGVLNQQSQSNSRANDFDIDLNL